MELAVCLIVGFILGNVWSRKRDEETWEDIMARCSDPSRKD
jgi:hypothetical protein